MIWTPNFIKQSEWEPVPFYFCWKGSKRRRISKVYYIAGIIADGYKRVWEYK